ncbi:MAG: DUF308 domain-containing protein [Anaerolineae bacterium]|nr:DUF308 domain-containing protein [Anaerolineae bacterium]
MDAISRQAYEQQLKRSWWLLVVRGFLLTILGFYALLNPTTDTDLITVLVGIYLLVDGAVVLLLSLFGRKANPGARTTQIRGLISLVAGAVVITAPAFAKTIAIYVAAAGLIVVGSMELINGIRKRDSAETTGSTIAVSLLLILTGFAIATLPTFTSEAVIRIIGLFAVPIGLYMLIYAGRLRHVIKALQAAS